MKKLMMALPLGALIVTGALVSCSQKADSTPNFIYKKAPNDTAIAKVNGTIVTSDEFYKGIESDIYDAEMKVYELKEKRLRALVLEKLINSDKRKGKLTNDQFLEKYIIKAVKVSDKEIAEFAKSKNIPADKMDEQLKGRIVQFLEMDKKKKMVDQWVSSQTKKKPVEVYLAKPKAPVFNVVPGNSPSVGNKNAKVTIVEFSDFQCPYCKRGSEVLTQIKKAYGDRVRIVFKQFPLPFHKEAKLASIASLCVHEQSSDKFWKYHDKLFQNQQNLKRPGLEAMAKELKVDMKKFGSCLDSGKFANTVEAEKSEGEAIGVKSTPTFFVNGRIVKGAYPFEHFKQMIDEDMKM